MAGERHVDFEEESVQLRLGQRIGALHLERVLRGQHEERPWQRTCRFADADRLLLHRFEQRRLGLRRSAVDLIGQDDVCEDRPRLEAQRPAAVEVFTDDGRANNVGGHQVGRELDAAEVQRQHVAECANQQRLTETRHTLEQYVAAAEQRDKHLAYGVLLADDDLAELAFDVARALNEVGDRRRVDLVGRGQVGHDVRV